ncbi:hypothetical protein CCACVL1_30615 [Corchorus capsularis]|uniref:Uncharacterized protein n=1 Tax=Corchorus capsularis TaxID=210143 RepID=A0A1R3FWL4_COCAP|nr:hypothetical protein CCACVL1_30615 [Corchorus capsularis]
MAEMKGLSWVGLTISPFLYKFGSSFLIALLSIA